LTTYEKKQLDELENLDVHDEIITDLPEKEKNNFDEEIKKINKSIFLK
jgi:hypothetical protein